MKASNSWIRNYNMVLTKTTNFRLTGTMTIFNILFFMLFGFANAQDLPFSIKSGLFDQTLPDNLGLSEAEGTETISIFKPSDTTDHFSNGAVMIVFKNYFYCMWQSSATDEDAADTWVAYSRSGDGKNWSAPMILATSINDGYCSSGGWWAYEDTLVGYINTWPSNVSPRGGYTRYTVSTDGLIWSEPKPLLMADGDTMKGIFEQDPHALPDGRIINAVHFQPGLNIAPVYTDDPSGISGWKRANFTNLSTGEISREIEPSWFLGEDSAVVMIFRDQNSTYFKLASVSTDRGENWTTPVLTDMPDSRSKQSAGNFPDGTAFFVSNPVNNKLRIPLVVTLSKDGYLFNKAYLLREGGDGIQELRYTGSAKRSGYHYPKSIIWDGYLYASYATNKEDVEYTRVPLNKLIIDTIPNVNISPLFSENSNTTIHINADRIIKISQQDYAGDGMACIFNIHGQLVYSCRINNSETYIDMKHLPAGSYIIDIRTVSERKSVLFGNW